ncbi:hypothetical protein ACWGJ2_04540 [Streptomyces sp. NPDC054796]
MKRGYWCECHRTDENGAEPFTASFDAYTPHQAVRWIRLGLRIIVSGLGPEPAEVAWTWLHEGHRQALHDLATGQPVTLTLHHRTTTITWTARPVLFLPLAHREGRKLPTCADHFPEPQHPHQQH